MSWKAFIYYQVDNIESVIVSAVPPLHIKNHDLKLFHLHDLNGLIAETNVFIVSIHASGSKRKMFDDAFRVSRFFFDIPWS